MTRHEDNEHKAEKPFAHFDKPDQVVTDEAMSKDQKRDALDVLEQDARQLATASNEGMSGGELNQLNEVLEARQTLETPPVPLAYATVLADLRARREASGSPETVAEIGDAIALLETLTAAA